MKRYRIFCAAWLFLLAGCGSAVSRADAEAKCNDMTPAYQAGELTLRAYYDAFPDDSDVRLLDMEEAMKEFCPKLIQDADDTQRRAASLTREEYANLVIGESVAPEPLPVPSSEPPGDGLSCAQRYANARNPIFTREEQESLVLGVDVDCNPERAAEYFNDPDNG